MFTSGQLVFAIFFVIAFTLIIVASYRKDKKLHTKHYKGAFWVLIGFVVFMAILLAIKYYLKN